MIGGVDEYSNALDNGETAAEPRVVQDYPVGRNLVEQPGLLAHPRLRRL